MTKMLGRGGGLNLISGLLEVVKDPKKVADHVKNIQDAEAAYKKTVDTAVADLTTKRQAIAAATSDVARRETNLASQSTDLASREERLSKASTDLADKTAKFEAWEKATSTELATHAAALEEAQAKYDATVNKWNTDQANALFDINQQRAELKRREAEIDQREKEVVIAESANAEKAAKLKELLR